MKYTIIASKGRFASLRDAAFAEESIDWWDDSRAAEQSACTIAWAAVQLSELLPGDTILRDVSEVTADSEFEGTVIWLGNAANHPAKFLEEKLCETLLAGEDASLEGFRMVGRRIGGAFHVVLSGLHRAGTMYAAFAYCERLGLRFIEPEKVSFDASLACEPGDFDVSETPSFIMRGTMSSFIAGGDDFLIWMARNRFNNATFRQSNTGFAMRKKLCIDTSLGGHQMQYLYVEASQEYPYCHEIYGGDGKPRDPYPVSHECRAPSGEGGIFTYGDAHPEWYALIDGVRRMERFPERFKETGNVPGDNLCTSNPDAMHELALRVVEGLIDGVWKYADYINIAPLDNGAWCECENCRRQGNVTTRMLMMAYAVSKEIEKARREGRLKRPVRLTCPAYHETLPVLDKPLPDDFDFDNVLITFYPIERCYVHDIDDPICTESNVLMLDRLLPWTQENNYKGGLMIGEYYNVSTFAAMPFVLSSRILHDLPFYYRKGCRYFNYMHISARDWGIIGINNYLYGRLIWNIGADGDELLHDYFTARYGSHADEMAVLYREIEAAAANCKYYKHYQFVGGPHTGLRSRLQIARHQTEDDLFLIKHMRLHDRADDPQAGPSLQETLEGLVQAERHLETLTASAEGTALENMQQDVRRLHYGTEVTRFMYLMCMCCIGEGGEDTLNALHRQAEMLAGETDIMKCYDSGLNLNNALNATWLAETYRNFYAEE